MDIWRIRTTIGEMLSRAAPKYKRSLVDWKTPERHPDRLPDIGYVRTAPKVESYRPDCDDFRPR